MLKKFLIRFVVDYNLHNLILLCKFNDNAMMFFSNAYALFTSIYLLALGRFGLLEVGMLAEMLVVQLLSQRLQRGID